jgi:hypothetical protein
MLVGSRSPLLEVKVTPGQKAIHHFTSTSNLQKKKLLKYEAQTHQRNTTAQQVAETRSPSYNTKGQNAKPRQQLRPQVNRGTSQRNN